MSLIALSTECLATEPGLTARGTDHEETDA